MSVEGRWWRERLRTYFLEMSVFTFGLEKADDGTPIDIAYRRTSKPSPVARDRPCCRREPPLSGKAGRPRLIAWYGISLETTVRNRRVTFLESPHVLDEPTSRNSSYPFLHHFQYHGSVHCCSDIFCSTATSLVRISASDNDERRAVEQLLRPLRTRSRVWAVRWRVVPFSG
jgi:hypothetical protein